jgi:TPP-dependent pyruvate/acetoin dehydrogenase alpha subunit
VNLATVWSLPLVVVCENNQYAVETPITSTMRGESIAARAAGFGLPAVRIDGQDVGAVYHTMARARRRALAGEGPTFIEAVTYRYHGHNTGEVVTYRTQEEVDSWRRTRDPIDRLREAMARAGQLSDDEDAALVARAHEIVADAVAFAQSSPWPDAAGAASGVTGLRPDVGDHA